MAERYHVNTIVTIIFLLLGVALYFLTRVPQDQLRLRVREPDTLVHHETPDTDAVSVLTLNTFAPPLIVSFMNRPWQRARLTENFLAQRLASLDVVVLEEMWARPFRSRMKELFSREGWYVVQGDYVRSPFLIDSGVWIASRWPIAEAVERVFADRTGSDTLAAKSAVRARVLDPRGAYDVVGTHMQENVSHRHEEILREQLDITMNCVDGSVPSIIIGDFNYAPSFVARVVHPFTVVSTSQRTHAKGCIDYAIVSEGAVESAVVAESAGLSDHMAVEVRWTPAA
jgi:endonuclease/exonuclease/phosphatase family metal-dependent hydrolase